MTRRSKMHSSGEVGTAVAARALGVTLDYLYSLVWSGKLGAQKVDGKWLIPLAEIEKRKAHRRAA